MRIEIRILYLERTTGDAGLAGDVLKKAGVKCEIISVCDRQTYLTPLTGFAPDLILSDDALPLLNSI